MRLLAYSLVLIGLHQAIAQDVCSYESCPAFRSDVLNVHMISHSHDDVGWLKTVDQYYLGSRRNGWQSWEELHKAGVQYILDTVTQELETDPSKKFVQVETAFFWRWWDEQEDATKELFAELVNAGQIHFAGGGWSMNDEAAAHYVAIIDNLSLGLRKLNLTFGDCGTPHVAWQIDPFGHSREQAAIFAAIGFDGLFFGRQDWRDMTKRRQELRMEEIWHSSPDLGSMADLFFGVLHNLYVFPSGFCFDISCDDEPITDTNLDQKARDFIDAIKDQAQYYKSNHAAMTMGMDFMFQNAHSWYKNMDKLIAAVNAIGDAEGVHLFYSTPTCYLKGLNDDGLTWSTKSDDFFPHANDYHTYWNGYYTSRPNSKRLMHESSQALQAVKRMASAVYSASANPDDDADWATVAAAMEQLERATGVVQHHDAITGTEKQHVADDYHETLHAALVGADSATAGLNGFHFCPLANISQCQTSETSTAGFTISVYNPMASERSSYVRVPVTSEEWTVTNAMTDEEVVFQTVPVPEPVLVIPGRDSAAIFDLVFRAENIPALGFNFYHASSSRSRSMSIPAEGMWMGNVFLDGTTGTVSRLRNSKQDEVAFEQTYGVYTGFAGDNSEFVKRASGAYIFRPVETESVSAGEPGQTGAYLGPVVDEVHLTYNEYISQVLRIYHDTDGEFEYEAEWLVGPIPIDDDNGKEIVHVIRSPDVANAGLFSTDANGRQMLERERNHRPTFDYNATEEPVASNMYPITSRMWIQDSTSGARITVLNDRSQAGGSIRDGEMELLVHRRLLLDDAFGVGEALNETAFGEGIVARGKHYLLLDTDADEANRRHRLLANRLFSAPVVTLANSILDIEYLENFASRLSVPMTTNLPENVNLLTLQPLTGVDGMHVNAAPKTYLVRLEHLFALNDHPELSQPASVDVVQLLAGLGTVEDIRETHLAGNRYIEEIKRLEWTEEAPIADRHHVESKPVAFNKQLDPIELQATQIRTFIVTVQ